jgi:hypothetical protein
MPLVHHAPQCAVKEFPQIPTGGHCVTFFPPILTGFALITTGTAIGKNARKIPDFRGFALLC